MQFLQRLRHSAPEGGFTFIEALVVMLIFGILAAIALPAFFSSDEIVTAEVCGVEPSESLVELPKEAGSIHDFEGLLLPTVNTVHRFKINSEQTVTSVEPPKKGDEILRC